jgi:hypothetical protein
MGCCGQRCRVVRNDTTQSTTKDYAFIDDSYVVVNTVLEFHTMIAASLSA